MKIGCSRPRREMSWSYRPAWADLIIIQSYGLPELKRWLRTGTYGTAVGLLPATAFGKQEPQGAVSPAPCGDLSRARCCAHFLPGGGAGRSEPNRPCDSP